MDEIEQLLKEHDALLTQKRTKPVRTRLTKIKELIGVTVARQRVVELYGAERIVKFVDVPTRGKGTDVLDLLVELDDGKLVLVEAKCSVNPLGRTVDRRAKLVQVKGGKAVATPLNLKDQIQQLDPLWVKDRIKLDLRKRDPGLAKRLDAAMKNQILEIVEVRSRVEVTDAGQSVLRRGPVTNHTKDFYETAKLGGRSIGGVERQYARQEALARLYAKEFELEEARLRAREHAIRKELKQARTELRNAEDGFEGLTRQHAIEARKQKITAARARVDQLKTSLEEAGEAARRYGWMAKRELRNAEEYGLARKIQEIQKAAVREAELIEQLSPPITDLERGLVERPKKPPAHLTRPDAPDAETPKVKPADKQARPEEAAEDERKPVRRDADKPGADDPKGSKTKASRADEPPAAKAAPEPDGDPGTSKSERKPAKATEKPGTSRKSVARGDPHKRDLGDPLTMDRTEPRARPAKTAAPTAAKVKAGADVGADVQKLTRRARVTEIGLKGLKVVGKAGRLVFRLLNVASPVFTLLDAVDVVDRLVAFLKRKEIEEQKEWKRLAEFFFDPPKKITNVYGITYTTSIREPLDDILKHAIADPARTSRNVLFWYEKWRTGKWDGFVYAFITAQIEKQVTTSDVPYPTKYYWGPIAVEFVEAPRKNSRAERRTSGTRLGAGSEGNYSTPVGSRQVYAPAYAIDVDPYIVDVQINYPQPYLTPFDFIRMKCETLIAEIVSFSALYDPTVVEGMNVSDAVLDGVRVFWWRDARLQPPLHSDNVVGCLWALDYVVDQLGGHAHGPGDSARSKINARYTNGYHRRLRLLQTLAGGWARQTPKGWERLRGRRLFDYLRGPLFNLLAKETYTAQETADLHALSELASSIDDDLRRVLAECKAEKTAVKFNYEAVAAP